MIDASLIAAYITRPIAKSAGSENLQIN